ncbi:MAG: dTDP-4-amino-4,6-dideoxygalactose transaminase [Candidatus Omnitrophica bacterium]|nr:dTDP-4-amino-4,6-dideoxygalactose transaminase [Candidatus Omnitrophota bacterium]
MKKVPLHKPYWGFKEIFQVIKTILLKKGGGGGPFGELVEKKICELLNIKFAFLCNSGTSALEMSLMALNLSDGFEAILPAFTFVSTANAVVRERGIPVFVDIEETTYNIDTKLIEKKITKKTKVIIPVHYAGVGCKMDEILAISKKYNLFVIEDAAHAFGSKYKTKYLGTFGDLGCYSFHITKNLTCGEGGCCVTDNEELAEIIETIRDKGTDRQKFLRKEVSEYKWVSKGSNFLMSDILAGILYQQINRLNKINKLRRKKAIYLWEKLKNEIREEIILPELNEFKESNWHIFAIRVKNEEYRNKLIEYLNKKGIQASFHYLPLHLSPFVQKNYNYKPGDFPITELVAKTLIRIPLYPQISYREINYIVKSIKEGIYKIKHDK